MEKLLTTISPNEKEMIKTLNSKEVAEMIDIEHSKLLRNIRNYSSILAEAKIGLGDYFIESIYKDANNQERPCFEITKIGCDMVANKLTGTKGILFTARYVKKFDDMEKQLQKNVCSYMIQDPIERAKQWILEQEQSRKLLAEKDDIIEELSPLASICRERMDKTGTISFTDVTDTYDLKVGQISCWAKIKGYLSRSKNNKEVNQEGKEYFKTIVDVAGHKNIAIKEEGLRLIDKYIEEIKKSPCRFKMELVK